MDYNIKIKYRNKKDFKIEFTKDKKTQKSLKKLKQGFGKYFVFINLPYNSGSFKLLVKFNKGKSIILKIYKDGNYLSKQKETYYGKIISKSW
jgi:hypothetical protein